MCRRIMDNQYLVLSLTTLQA